MTKFISILKLITCSLFLSFLIIGCDFTANRNQLDQISKDSLNVTKDIESDSANYFKVKEICAVFFAPDTTQINKMIAEVGQDKFFTMADDHNNYNSEAMEYLDKKGLKYTTTKKPIIEFLKSDGTKYKINLLKYNYSWGILLFDGVRDAKKIDALNIEKEYKLFFKSN